MNHTYSDRLLAGFLHLAYLPGLLGIALAILFPSAATILLPLCALWLICLVAGLLFEPKNAFLASHLSEARRYHVSALVVTGVAFVVLFASGLVTWGVGSAFALVLLPCSLLITMIPTFVGAYHALRGQEHEYDRPWEEWVPNWLMPREHEAAVPPQTLPR